VDARTKDKDLKTFAACLKLRAGVDGATRELPVALHTELNAAFNRFFKLTRDPYKVCFCVALCVMVVVGWCWARLCGWADGYPLDSPFDFVAC
jgi:hypothetical protein